PGLHEVLDRIEGAPKPVVAAVHGTALGGGLEVALACHYRVGVKTARFGLPEVRLGLLPGAGGTQRLPRVVGVEKALQMIVSGDPIGADAALNHGLIDAIVEVTSRRPAWPSPRRSSARGGLSRRSATSRTRSRRRAASPRSSRTFVNPSHGRRAASARRRAASKPSKRR